MSSKYTSPQPNKDYELLFKEEAQREGRPLHGQEGDSFEIYLRELLQNAMDACIGLDRPCHVRFRMGKISPEEIPAWEQYCQALDDCIESWENSSSQTSNSDNGNLNYVKQLKKRSKTQSLKVLYVIDNGAGMNDENLEAILSKGAPCKGSGASGSKGVGHLVSFVLSGLKFVFYASTYKEEGGRTYRHGAGHALLTSHYSKKSKKFHDANGYCVESFTKAESSAQGDMLSPRFKFLRDAHVPNFMQKQLPIEGTGSVVAILDFMALDDQQELKQEEIVEKIKLATFRSFFVALFQGHLSISIEDEDAGEETINRSELERYLAEYKKTEKSNASDLAFYSDLFSLLKYVKNKEVAKEEDFRSGYLPAPFTDCPICLLRQSANTSVSVWRNGMLITKTDIAFSPSRFIDCKPFNAAILLSGKEKRRPTHDLIRRAESPNHDKINVATFELKDDEKEMIKQWRSDCRDWLRTNAEQYDGEEEILDDILLDLPGSFQLKQRSPSEPRTSVLLGGEGSSPGKPDDNGGEEATMTKAQGLDPSILKNLLKFVIVYKACWKIKKYFVWYLF